MLVRSLRYFVLLVLVTGVASAQQQPAPPAATRQAQATSPAADPVNVEKEKEVEKQEQSQRMLGVVPMFGVTHEHARPLTPKEKFHLAAKSTVDPFTFFATAFQAGLGQASNEFSGYGQGAAGYGRRFGATYGDQVSSAFFSNFFYPVLFKEDPRFFRLGEGPMKTRMWHAVREEFVCHTDKGGRRFNTSNVAGAFSSGLLSTVYYPDSDKGVNVALGRASISLAYGIAGDFLDEFWPDINRKLFHRHSSPSATPAAAHP